jgi:hypothetical protein
MCIKYELITGIGLTFPYGLYIPVSKIHVYGSRFCAIVCGRPRLKVDSHPNKK